MSPTGGVTAPVDAPVGVLALIGLAFLLFLAGLEIDVHKLRGRPLILALTGFVVSFAIAVGVALLLAAGGFARRRCWSRSSCAPRRWGWWCRCSRTPASPRVPPGS